MSEQPLTPQDACLVSPLTVEQRTCATPWLITGLVARFAVPPVIDTTLLTLYCLWPRTFELRSVIAWMAVVSFCCWVVEYYCWEQLARIGGREDVLSRRDRWIRLVMLTLLFGLMLYASSPA